MPDPDDLARGLRGLAEQLDRESRVVDPQAAMERAPLTRSRRRRALVPAVGAAVVVAGALVALRLGDNDDARPVETTDVATTSAPEPSTTTSATPPDYRTTTYTGTSTALWPESGIAVIEGDELVFLGPDGAELGHATTPITNQLGRGSGLDSITVRTVIVLELAEPDAAEAPSGCDNAAGAGGVRVALCGGADQQRQQVVRVDPSGETSVLAEAAPGSAGSGHWRWALPSPDGRWVLAQWSGECEVPVAFLIPTDGGEMRTVDGKPELDGTAVESSGVGWTPDGEAIVRYYGGACGSGSDEPGTYLVDPATGRATLVRAAPDDAGGTFTWHREDFSANAPERAFTRALDELGLESCCGEPSDGGENATVGVRWEGFDVPAFGGPVTQPPFVPFNDLVISAEPVEIDGLAATAGTADLGPFVAFTCDDHIWTLGGAGLGDRATAASLRSLAGALIPRLYCTVGDRPQATGHGVP